jgi:glycosyltransferase involved in cell wall biosynthesis
MLNLVGAFLARGRDVDLVLCRATGAYLDSIPDELAMVELEATAGIPARIKAALSVVHDLDVAAKPVLLARKIAPEIARLHALRRYIRNRRPDVILSAITYANLIAIWAGKTRGIETPVVVSERIALSAHCLTPANQRRWRWRYLPELVNRFYPFADAVVSVSEQVAEDLSVAAGLDRRHVATIYNPVVDDALRRRAQEPLEHEWFAPGAIPVILGAGRLAEQKDFSTLIRAFARLREGREARLVILGEGKQRYALEGLAGELGVRDDVLLPGFVENPFWYMARASVFALSSRYEGLPGVLIQALACGCPVISTNCPGGSAVILANGKYGPLVDVGDVAAMAGAIESQLDNPTARDLLLGRAEDFSVERAADRYLELLDDVVAGAGARVQVMKS